MIESSERLLLIGDNPFHRISHLSQARARNRTEDLGDPKYAANLIHTALENGANGFTFSVSETTIAILKELDKLETISNVRLYPVVPYAFEYVRFAAQLGGIPGLVRRFGIDMLKSRRLGAIGYGLKGALTADPVDLMKTYLSYEISRVRSSTNKGRLDSVWLHQLITDMALALNLDWLFKSYFDFLTSRKITPGFNTGNFAFLAEKFDTWNIDLSKVLIAAPFNRVGFQMTPSAADCEKALMKMPKPVVIAISVLAAGFIPPKEAADYLATLPNIKGVALGVSKLKHATETFEIFKKRLDSP